MNQWPLIGVIFAAWVGLLFWSVPHEARVIEHDITARSQQALIDGNIAIPEGGLKVDGRDVTLTGVRGSAIVSDTTRALVQALAGVRDPVHVVVTEPPAPPPMPVEAQKLEADLTKFLEGKTIRFDPESAAIHPEGKAVLDQVVRILATSPMVAVDIAGHTDNVGDEKDNLLLSKRRAAAVKDYLVSRGVKPERLETEGFGSSKPLVANDTPANKARNRRIEFHANGRVPGTALSNR